MKAGLDHIHAHRIERFRHQKFFVEIHRHAGRLLAVAQGGIENNDAVFGHMEIRQKKQDFTGKYKGSKRLKYKYAHPDQNKDDQPANTDGQRFMALVCLEGVENRGDQAGYPPKRG